MSRAESDAWAEIKSVSDEDDRRRLVQTYADEATQVFAGFARWLEEKG